MRPAAAAETTAKKPGRNQTTLNASGYVTARRAATVSSKVTGKVIEVLVEEGMKVEAGAGAGAARCVECRGGAAARGGATGARAEIAGGNQTEPRVCAREELKRFTGLAATKVVSDSDLRRSEDGSARAGSAAGAADGGDRGRRTRSRAMEAAARRHASSARRSAGVVTSKNAQPGEMISPMSVGGFTRTGICTIVDMSSLEIEVDVNESYINRVQPGGPVEATLDAYPEWAIPAKVIAIIPTADRQKATVKVRVGFDQLDPRILAGDGREGWVFNSAPDLP